MMAHTHAIFGMLAGIGWATHTGEAKLPAMGLGVLGSLLPDIDHPHSWVGRRLPFISWPLTVIVGHRGITHSLLAALACLAVLVQYGHSAIAVPIVLGYLTHLAADYCTRGGVPLFWPYKGRMAAPLTINTGGVLEHFVAVSGWVAAAWMFWRR